MSNEYNDWLMENMVEFDGLEGRLIQLAYKLVRNNPFSTSHEIASDHLKDAAKELHRRQAKIDSLMLEYCPDEMTLEQRDNWAKHQRIIKDNAT